MQCPRLRGLHLQRTPQRQPKVPTCPLIAAFIRKIHQFNAFRGNIEAARQWEKSPYRLVPLEAIPSRLEAIAIKLEAMASRMEAITIRLEAIASRMEAIAHMLEAISIRLEAIAIRLEAGGHRY